MDHGQRIPDVDTEMQALQPTHYWTELGSPRPFLFVTRTHNEGAPSGDPQQPVYTGTLAQGRDGNIYSTSHKGGSACWYCGTVFKITPSGAVTVIYDFDNKAGVPSIPYEWSDARDGWRLLWNDL